MVYEKWLRQVRQLVNEAGCSFADLDGWDWPGSYAYNSTPEEAADEALRDRWYMSESDLDFYDYMAFSDADPGL